MSNINQTVPEFKTTAYHDGEFTDISSEDTKGKWSVFFFYPADFTFVCPTELGDMADHYEELQNLGVEVYSVSTDKHFTHKAWHDASDTIKEDYLSNACRPYGRHNPRLRCHGGRRWRSLKGYFRRKQRGCNQGK